MPDPTADATRLLPCPFCQSTAVLDDLGGNDSFFVRCTKCEVQQIANYSKTEAVSRWNSRPQPEPLAGEPDFVFMAGEISNLLGEARAIPHVKIIEAALRDAYDIGQASRPKVEDADEELRRQAAANSELIATYRDIFAEITAKAAPLTNDGDRITSYAIPCGPIHRAAGKLGFQMFDGEKHMQEVLAKLVEERQRAETTEAELATAYEVIELCRSALTGAPSLIAREAIAAWDTKRDAARQQHKDTP